MPRYVWKKWMCFLYNNFGWTFNPVSCWAPSALFRAGWCFNFMVDSENTALHKHSVTRKQCLRSFHKVLEIMLQHQAKTFQQFSMKSRSETQKLLKSKPGGKCLWSQHFGVTASSKDPSLWQDLIPILTLLSSCLVLWGLENRGSRISEFWAS